MTVDIKDIRRKDTPIYYRMIYEGRVVVTLGTETSEVGVGFILETKPTGVKDIFISFEKAPEVPIIPLKTAIKAKIEELDAQGRLPF